jgi:hypothetical protein
LDNKINILIFPAGSESALDIYRSLKNNVHLEVFGASSKSDHAEFIYPKTHYCQGNYNVNQSDFLDSFNGLLSKWKIDAVIPTHDTVALFLTKNIDRIKTKIICSPYKSALIAHEKKLTYDKFKDFSFCPIIYNTQDKIKEFPVFIKPNTGAGGKGTIVVYNQADIKRAKILNPDILICEYLSGDEITVDCFTNKNRELMFVGPRTRERVQMGISFRSKAIELTSEILEIGKQINNELELRGAWFFQLKRDKTGMYKLMEISVRQAGTMAVYRQLGINFALLSIYDHFGYTLSILYNNLQIELDRCLQNRYRIKYSFNKVYVDFDDTIIINHKVNLDMITFLYQCKNEGIKVYLLSKHSFDLKKSLDKYCISANIFDEIIHIPTGENKATYINPVGAIFIDNYFFDREDVRERTGIPVFDVDAIECLIK